MDFYSDNCPACRYYDPVLKTLSDMNGIAFGKINVEQHMEVLEEFGITAIPVIMAFKDGKLVDVVIGANPDMNKRFQKIGGLIEKLKGGGKDA